MNDMPPLPDGFANPPCRCYVPPIFYQDYTIVELAEDTSNGKFATITTETCIHCGTIWLKYLAEDEHYTASGRWYRGVITHTQLQLLQPDHAVPLLESMDWWIYGGSFFNSTGKYGRGKIQP